MSPEQLRQAIEQGRELRHVEFKGAGHRQSKPFLYRVVRAVLALANTADGGSVVIGVEERPDGTLDPKGLTADQRASWRADYTHDSIRTYADPVPAVLVEEVLLDDRSYVVLTVSEFPEIPILCRKPATADGEEVLREGACYHRPRLKRESAEVRSYAEMRELFDLATEKALVRYLGTAHRAGASVQARESDAERFAAELQDFF